MVHTHRPVRRWRALAVVLAGLTLTAACGTSSSDDGTEATSTSTPTTEESATEVATEGKVSPIDGTWATATIGAGDFRRALARQGLGEYADHFVSDMGNEVDLTLEISDAFWTLSSSSNGRPPSVTDRGTFTMQGERVLVRPHSGGENLFRWNVDGDELTLKLVSTTEPPYEGVPAETYQRGLYTTSSFQRAS